MFNFIVKSKNNGAFAFKKALSQENLNRERELFESF
jgi:hypothetical protein